jgi:hypothetical protein
MRTKDETCLARAPACTSQRLEGPVRIPNRTRHDRTSHISHQTDPEGRTARMGLIVKDGGTPGLPPLLFRAPRAPLWIITFLVSSTKPSGASVEASSRSVGGRGSLQKLNGRSKPMPVSGTHNDGGIHKRTIRQPISECSVLGVL